MNRERRKVIKELIIELEDLYSQLEEVKDEEQESYDNLPENLQESSRGEAASEAIDNLESALSSIDEAREYLESAI